jgi:hypothetical protein
MHCLRMTGAILVSSVLLFAQLNRGTITGTVSDNSGAVIPSVKMTIRNAATGAQYEAVSNESGQYTAANLPTGTYKITYEAPSFKKLERSGIELGVTQVLRVDAILEVGSVTESIAVTAETPRLQTDSPDVGTSLSNKQLIDLPLTFSGARIAENFAYLVTPGVSGNTWTSNINGSSSFSKESLLDGATVTTYLAGHFSESSVSVEALSEFKIQTSGMSAEFGRAQAGVFNYVMKSGSNQLHGSAYGALRNEALDANTAVNKFNNRPRGLDRRQNYAFSGGAPVYIPKIYNGKNKTFFYTTFEGYRERLTGFAAPNVTAPQPEFLDGDFSRLLGASIGQTDALNRPVLKGAVYDPLTFRQLDNGRYVGDMFPGNRIPVSRISQVSQRVNALLKKGYLPTVRNPDGSIPLTNNAIRPAAGTPEFDQYQFSTKVDQNIGDKQKVAGSISWNKRPRLLLDQTRLWDPSDPVGGVLTSARRQTIKSELARISHDYNISPRLLNTFSVYYNRMGNPNIGNFKDIDGAKELGIKNMSTFGFPNIDFSGGPFVNLTNIGDPQNDYQVYMGFGLIDTVSFSKGRHFMKAGIDLRHNHLNTRPTQGGGFIFNARGTAIPNEAFSGNQTGYAFASYLLGIVDSASLSDPVGLGGRRAYSAFFFQDDFKVSDRLTLNLGLRWEYQPPFTEVADRLSSWNPNKVDPATGRLGAYDFAGTCSACTGQHYFGGRSFRDFGPRIGFAYRLANHWTLRGAYGIMYEGDLFNGFSGTPLGKATSVQAGGTYSFSADPVNPWAGIFNWDNGLPTNRYSAPGYDVSFGDKNRPGIIDPNYGKSPYVQQWNFNVQREIVKDLVLDVGYVGNKSTGLRNGQMILLNQLDPKYLQIYGSKLNNAVKSAADAASYGIAYPYPGFQGTLASALRPYPQVQGNQTVQDYGAPIGFSTYHSLQITLNHQSSKGFTTYTNYTWSKNLTNISSSQVNDNANRPLDYYNLRNEKALADDDQAHLFKGYVSYDLPFGRGKSLLAGSSRIVNTLVGGWSVSAILNYFSGTPLGFAASNPLTGSWNGGVNRANVAAGDLKVPFDKSTFQISPVTSAGNTYLNKALFSDAPALTLGSSAFRYAQARNFGRINEDFGLQKNTKLGEHVRFQLRAEFLNAFNRSTLGGIQTGITNVQFGQVTSISGNRQIQVGTRLDF